jgi:molecular chaperone Hsp33
MMDRVSRFLLRGAPVRGEIVSLDEAWREVVSRHDLPSAVRDRLGELSAASLLLAATLKFEGALVVQIHGDGPVALFVVECQTDGSYRATVKLREDAPESIVENASLASLVNAGGTGRFVVTLDPHGESPHHQAWQGIVPFDGDSVAEMLEHYMDRSEQLPTRLWLAADERLELPPEEVLQRLFWQESLHAFDERGLHFACSCSRDKVVGMLRMLGRYEVDSILAERGAVEVRCDFCNELWRLDPVDCAVAFTESPELAPASATRH